MPEPERLGILGGTFDPVHVGHLVAAAEVRYELGLDRVLLTVAAKPWQKGVRVVAPQETRLAMVSAAVAVFDGLEADDVEIVRGGPTYSADTIAEHSAPHRELFLIVGSDVARGLESWKRIEEVRSAVTLVVVDRGDAADAGVDVTGWKSERVSIPRLDVSSSDIRARLAKGRPVAGLVPAGAIRVIREAHLYTRS